MLSGTQASREDKSYSKNILVLQKSYITKNFADIEGGPIISIQLFCECFFAEFLAARFVETMLPTHRKSTSFPSPTRKDIH